MQRLGSLDKDVEAKLSSLASLLLSLPETIPNNSRYYRFENFALTQDDIEDYGDEGALNHALEITFAPQGRHNGPIVLKEQGPGLSAVVPILKEYLRRYPASAILLKWVDDLIEAARRSGGVCLSHYYC
jgi:hypothetical protein